MFTKNLKSILTILFAVIVLASFSLASNGVKDSTKQMNNMKMHNKDMKEAMHKMKMDSTKKMQSSIIRKGVIDVKSIDKNKDGKVFQDMMDYNVISDKPGKCPICGMKLKEVSVKQAKEMLVKSGFKVKK